MDTATRERLLEVAIAEALTWEGTPYHHRGFTKGVGCDCGTLIYESFNKIIELPPFPRNYAMDWALHNEDELYLDFIMPYVDEVTFIRRGDLVVWQYGRKFSHGSISLGKGRFIHAWGRNGEGSVRISLEKFFHVRLDHIRHNGTWRRPRKIYRWPKQSQLVQPSSAA